MLARNKPHEGRYYRHGFNPGSVNLRSQKIKLDVPSVYDQQAQKCVGLSSYDHLQELPNQGTKELEGVLKGLSTRDYKQKI